jgi:hypothetical protein
MLLLGLPGLFLQGFGFERMISQGASEIQLFMGLLLFAVGTIFWMVMIEYVAAARGCQKAWVLTAFAGPLGLIAIFLLKGKTNTALPEDGMMPAKPNFPDRIVGMVLTLIVTFGFIWAAWQLVNRGLWDRSYAQSHIFVNEMKVYQNLRRIAEAQEWFKDVDWDGDGAKTYSPFIAHLWSTLDHNIEPLQVRLIPKKVAFAMEKELAEDGYYYLDLRERDLQPERPLSKRQSTRREPTIPPHVLDPANEWAIAAIPDKHKQTGIHTFVVDNSARIYAKDLDGGLLIRYPFDPLGAGWTEVTHQEDVQGLHKKAFQSK